jgi:IS5 family transposase
LGDQGYVSNKLKRYARRAEVFRGVCPRASAKPPMTEANKCSNRKMSPIRPRADPIFRVIKGPLGYAKTCYKGIAKNAAQVFSLIRLTNLYLARRALMN